MKSIPSSATDKRLVRRRQRPISSTPSSSSATARLLYLTILVLTISSFSTTNSFTVDCPVGRKSSILKSRASVPRVGPLSVTTDDRRTTGTSLAQPRTGFLQGLLDFVLASPLWKLVLVPQARQKMVDTAASNGIPWQECKEWLLAQPNAPWKDGVTLHSDSNIPDYYKQSFHAYEEGNLCWEAAIEVEIASAAVGARNFPQYGRQGEDAFRNSFASALQTECGAYCPENGVIVDLGCGTGLSTRRLAQKYPQAKQILGIDLSPYYCKVGQFLLDMAPIPSIEEGGPWVNAIPATGNLDKSRIQYQVGDATQTGLPDNSVDVVNLQFVAHEMPYQVTLDVIREAHRILKPNGGQFWFCEMDFETPGYAAQRANPLLFSLIRSTEPYLDDYADHAQDIRDQLQKLFRKTIIAPATGRHFAIVATKGDDQDEGAHELIDTRFDEDGVYRVEDTHLKTFENKL